MHGTVSPARDLLLSIKKSNPSVDRDELLTLFRERLLKDKSARTALADVIEDFYTRNYTSLFSVAFAQSQEKRRATRAAVERETREYVERKKQIMLLDLVMPNGRRLRQCRKGEVGVFGGWLTDLDVRLKPGQTAGDFGERATRSVYDEWSRRKP